MSFAASAVWLLAAFLIGSIPTAYLVAKRVRGIDIREHGSGNAGATNVFRVAGKGCGASVLAIDVFKGLLVTALIAPTAAVFVDISPVLKQLLFGCAAIAGHTWTPWLKLKGGKGIATAAGSLFGIFPLAAVLTLLIWSLIFVIKHYVSLASIVAAGFFPVLLLLFYKHVDSFGLIFLISVGLASLLIYNHRSNIKRLRNGEEYRFEFGKKKDASSASES